MRTLARRNPESATVRRPAAGRAMYFAMGLTMALCLSSCVVGVDDGPYGSEAIGYGGPYYPYYETYGYVVGGWGNGYHVGPTHGGERGGRGNAVHSYRGAPATHHTPSIPSHSHRR